MSDTTNYGTVTGRVLRVIADGADADDNPDLLPATGTIAFTLAYDLARNTNLGILVPEKIVCTLDSAGDLTSPGDPTKKFVKLFPGDDPLTLPSGATYSVQISLTNPARVLAPFNIFVASGQSIDLKDFIPVAGSAGISVASATSASLAAAASAASASASAAAAAASAANSGGSGGGALTDGSVTNVKVSATAGISLDKTADAANRLAMTAAERTKLTTVAPLASPTFTGTVTVPTPTVASAATTKSYVDSKINLYRDLGYGNAFPTTGPGGTPLQDGDIFDYAP